MVVEQQFEIEIEGIIWKQFIDEKHHFLVIEGRNADLHQVSFYVVDIKKGKIICEISPEEETWWIGIEEVLDGKIIVHGYQNEQSPIHQGIYVYDAKTGKLAWENLELYFYQKDENTIWATNSESHFFQLDLYTGEILTEKNTLPSLISVMTELLELPFHYSQENEHFKTVSLFLNELQGVNSIHAIEYWESLTRMAISYYICDEFEKLENYLLILSIDGEILFQDCLEKGLSGIGMDTFYVYQQQLFFIQEKRKLICINL